MSEAASTGMISSYLSYLRWPRTFKSLPYSRIMTMMNKSYPIFYIKKENLQHSSKKTYKYLTEIHYNKEKKRRKLGWRSKKVYKRWIRRMETQKNYKQRKKLTNKQKRKKKKGFN